MVPRNDSHSNGARSTLTIRKTPGSLNGTFFLHLTGPDAVGTIFSDIDVKGPTLFDDFFPPPRRGRPIRPPICFTMEATPSHTDPPGAEPDLGGM